MKGGIKNGETGVVRNSVRKFEQTFNDSVQTRPRGS